MAPLPRRRARLGRPDRVFWAAGLTCLAVAGLYSSARAADQRVAWAALDACDVADVSWGYDVALVPDTGYAIAGVRFSDVPDACAEAAVLVTVTRGDGLTRTVAGTLREATVSLDPAVLATIAGPDMTAGWSLVG